jgi:hypothetical protein
MNRSMVRVLAVVFSAAVAAPAVATPAFAKTHHGGAGGGGGTLSSGTGVDVSYPQCGTTLPGGQAFGIVGVNGGLANDYNSCLAGQWTYASGSTGTTNQAKAQTYLNTADPGNGVADWPSPANYGSYPDPSVTPYGSCTYASGGSGPGAMSTACAYVYGYDMVVGGISDGTNGIVTGDVNAFKAATGATLNAQPVWLDVETGNSWLSGSTGLSMNIADLNGMVDALRATNSAATVGIYSTSYQWNQITGTPTASTAGNLWALPDWVAGATTQSGASSNCAQTAFTGGTLSVSQWTSGGLDYDYSCIG